MENVLRKLRGANPEPPPAKKAKRKIKNYKLKHSRLLMCHSALLYLLVLFRRKKTVSPDYIVEMIALTPTQRLEWLALQAEATDARPQIAELLSL